MLATVGFLHTILLLLLPALCLEPAWSLPGPCLWPGPGFFLSGPSDGAVLVQLHCLAQHREVLPAGHAAPWCPLLFQKS